MIQDTAYLAAVGVGTPAQAFELQVDTGSSNLWVAGEGAFGNDLQTQHSTFAPASSSSFQQISTQPVNLTYGSGAVQGIAGTDSITIGPVSMQDQAVIVGQRLSSGFTRAYFDGIIGLAFSSCVLSWLCR